MSYVLQHWSGAWAALAVWATVAALHLVGLRRLEAGAGRDGGGEPARREGRRRAGEAVAFHGGLLLALLALVSPLGYWSGLYIWARSIQDLLLAFIAPGLIVVGAPWPVLARGVRPDSGRAVQPQGEPDPPARTRWWLAWPVAVVVAFNVIWLGWHVTAPYDLAATNAVARYLEYVCYLAAGIAFWLQLIGSGPSRPALSPLRRLALLVATAVADAILGMVLVFGSGLVYPAYLGTAHHLLTVVSDQQAGGAVLWMGVLPALIIAAVALINGWLDAEESDELSRDLDAVLGRASVRPAAYRPGKAVWHARSGYRRPTI
jgi:cytochrome c oxidase assembly factor CtaG